MNKISNFDVEVNNGSVALIFQTKAHRCVMKFENELLQILIDGIVVFETGKE